MINRNPTTFKALFWVILVILFGVSAYLFNSFSDYMPIFINCSIIGYALFNIIRIFIPMRFIDREQVGNANDAKMLATMTTRDLQNLPRRDDQFLLLKSVIEARDVLARGGNFNIHEYLESWRVRLLAPVANTQIAVVALPMAGFLGTVLGLTTSLGAMAETIEASSDIDAIKSSMIEMISGMRFCFDSTVYGLCGALVLKPLVRHLENATDEILADVESFFGRFGMEEDDDS